jgi:ubiquinone/menaquinone biosynthesis C-methylase UbiE
MSVSAHDEREFYDRVYSQFLSAPDEELICTRATLLGDLNDPHRAIYERRRLFLLALDRLTREGIAGKSILDYGCGTGDWGLFMASEGAMVTLLDLSVVGIEVGMKRARAGGVESRVRGVARDASDLGCFEDGEFDMIFASAAVHHTLKYENATAELLRVLKPGGKLVLAETYGNNPLLNLMRRTGWMLRRQPEEAGEEILFGQQEIDVLYRNMSTVDVTPVNLLAMAKRVFRGHFASPYVRALLRTLESADAVLLKVMPFLKAYCGEVLVVAEK